MTDTTTETTDCLERLADEICSATVERDHGIAWARGEALELRKVLPGVPSSDQMAWRFCPIEEPDERLISLAWGKSPGGGSWNSLFTARLPSGRELLVDDNTAVPRSEVIGVIDRHHDHAHLRAFQAAISGERVKDPLFLGLPDAVSLLDSGIVFLDAYAQALQSSEVVASFLSDDSTEELDEPEWAERRDHVVTALEEEIEEAADDEQAATLLRQLESASETDSWLWSLDPGDVDRITALAAHTPPIPLYAPPGIPASFDPWDAAADPLFQAAAFLVALGEL